MMTEMKEIKEMREKEMEFDVVLEETNQEINLKRKEKREKKERREKRREEREGGEREGERERGEREKSEYEIGKERRIPYLCYALFQIFLVAGTIYGWPALAVIFVQEGVYAHLCSDSQSQGLQNSSLSTTQERERILRGTEREREICEDEIVQLGFCYTVASFALLSALLIFGILVDRIGPKAVNLIGITIVSLGMFTLSVSSPERDWYLLGLALVGFGGPSSILSFVHLSNLFPKNQPDILTLLNGAFALGTLVFVFWEVIYSSMDGELSLTHLTLSYGIFLIIQIVPGYFLWPSKPYTIPQEIKMEEGEEEEREKEESLEKLENIPQKTEEEEKEIEDKDEEKGERERGGKEREEGERERERGEDILERVKGMSLGGQMRENFFIFNFIFICLMMLPLQFHVGTLNSQLLYFGDDGSYVTLCTTIFNVGILIVPVSGWIINKGFDKMYALVNALGLLYNIFALVPSLNLQAVGAVAWGMHRIGFFSCEFSYIMTTFGLKNFGVLNGVTIFCAGVASFFQIFLIIIAQKVFDGDYFYINLMICVLRCFLFLYPLYLYYNHPSCRRF